MLTIYVTEGLQSSCLRNCEISKRAVVIDESYVNILFRQQTVKEYGGGGGGGGGRGGGRLLPITAYKGRLRPKGVPSSGFRYMNG